MKRIATFISNVFWHLLFLLGPVCLIGWICLLAWLIPMFGEMSPKNASRQNLTYWFFVRDFSKLPEGQRLPLAECYLREFGRESGKTPEFEFSDFVRNQIAATDTARRERIEQEVKVAKEPGKLLAIPLPKQERNVMTLAKAWFFDQMQKYEQADFQGKKERLSHMVTEIKWWQSYNRDFLLAAGVKPYGIPESLQELEMIFARWEAESSPEDAKRIAAFKPRVTAALINDGVNEVLGGDAGKTIGNVLASFHDRRKTTAKVKRSKNDAQEGR